MEADAEARAKDAVRDFLCWLDVRKAEHEYAMRALDRKMCWTKHSKAIEPWVEPAKITEDVPFSKAKLARWRFSARCLQWLARQDTREASTPDLAEAMGISVHIVADAMLRCRRYGLIKMRKTAQNQFARYVLTDDGIAAAERIRWRDGKPYLE